MIKTLTAILLATLAFTAGAEPVTRQVRLVCGSLEDVQATMEKYDETLLMVTQAPNELTVNLIYVNFETETSSWFIHDLQTNEYCVVGVGQRIYVPDESALKKGIGIETRIIYK